VAERTARVSFEAVEASRFRVHGPSVREARRRLGLTIEELASKCGWTKQYQSRIEGRFSAQVSRRAKEALEKVLA
jgi:transcriptional regulator with XRE-family HTH domain